MLGIGGKIALQETVGHTKVLGKKAVDASSQKLSELRKSSKPKIENAKVMVKQACKDAPKNAKLVYSNKVQPNLSRFSGFS